MTRGLIALNFALCCLPATVLASGPNDRILTNPLTVFSRTKPSAAPLDPRDVLTTTTLGGVTLSPDGSQIAYMANTSGRMNLWIMNADGTQPRQLVRSEDRQTGAVFSPNGQEIVYAQDHGGNEMYDLFSISVKGGPPVNLTSTETASETSALFSPDATLVAIQIRGKASPQTDIAVMTWPKREIHPMTIEADPRARWSICCWAPRGRVLYATRYVGLDESDVYRINATTGLLHRLTVHSNHEFTSVQSISPDGRTLLVTSNHKGGFSNVALLSIRSGRLRWVTSTEWQAHAGEFAPDGLGFTYSLNVDGRESLMFADIRTLTATTRGLMPGLNFAAGQPRSYTASGAFLFGHQDSTHPINLYTIRSDDVVLQVTHYESEVLDNVDLPRSQLVAYRSFDGVIISALVWVPDHLSRDKKAAAIVLPHGGPAAQTYDSFSNRVVLLLSRGFIVIAPNIRGSTGYGSSFERLNRSDLGGADLKDLVAGISFLQKTDLIDPHKVGIWGASYGGFLALMAIGQYPDMWAAAVDEYGIVNWHTMYEHSSPQLQQEILTLLGDPNAVPDLYRRSSPLTYMGTARTPLLILQGEMDVRVPKEEAAQLVDFMKKSGHEVTIVYYPNEGHGFRKKENQLDDLNRSLSWFTEHLQGK